MDKASTSEIRITPAPRAASRTPGSGRLTQATVIGSLIAALAASSCCVIPFLLFSLGTSGAWISRLTALSAYQPYFATGSLLLLAAGIALVYRRRRACATHGACTLPITDRLATWGLWCAGIVMAIVLAYPYLAPLLVS